MGNAFRNLTLAIHGFENLLKMKKQRLDAAFSLFAIHSIVPRTCW